jgi:methylase of polypeptide subunit release factors
MTTSSEHVRSEEMLFGPLTIRFDDRVLRPRRWTTAQSAWASELLVTAPDGPVLELCAGVGHIGLLALAGAARKLVLVDASEAACEHARANVAEADRSADVEIRCGRMDEVLGEDETFALIIADPPWVPTEETSRHPEDPLLAIDGGADGLDLARTCVELVGRHLDDHGSAVLQLGTTEQVGAIDEFVRSRADLRLQVAEHRTFDTGVLVRLARAED